MRIVGGKQEQLVRLEMVDQSQDGFALVGGVDGLRREPNMISQNLRGRPGQPGNLGPNALPGFVRPPDKSAQPGQAGFDRHLVKPVDPDDLEKLLMSLNNGASRTQLA